MRNPAYPSLATFGSRRPRAPIQQWPCTLLRSNRPAISPWRRLRPGTPTAHERVALPLLPSGPGGVRRFSLRGAQPSTPLAEAHSTRPALERGFDPARADCGQQGTATSPSSTATSKTKLAEGAGFEPAAQGLPVHGISSAAPSAARSPLRMQSVTPMPSDRKIWRRGEDLNPRGTFWAPIRFRVGRLQPGSATPPHTYMTRDASSCLTVKSRASCIAAAPSGAATKAAELGSPGAPQPPADDPGPGGRTAPPSPANPLSVRLCSSE